jgi:hypothetical protein
MKIRVPISYFDSDRLNNFDFSGQESRSDAEAVKRSTLLHPVPTASALASITFFPQFD